MVRQETRVGQPMAGTALRIGFWEIPLNQLSCVTWPLSCKSKRGNTKPMPVLVFALEGIDQLLLSSSEALYPLRNVLDLAGVVDGLARGE